MSEKNQRGYWSVLPGEIVHDKSLSIAAKYLYIILSSMAYEKGFCWPSNESIASEMGLSKRRVVELLAMLRDARYIKILFKPYGKGERRYIYCGMFPERTDIEPDDDGEGCEDSPGGDAEDCAPLCENSHDPHAKNTFAISSRKINKKNKKNLPPKSQTEKKMNSKYELQEDARPLLNAYVGNDPELTAAMQDMIANRVELKAVNSARAIKAMLSELDRLSGGSRQNKLALLRRAISSNWKTVYPMRPDELPDKPALSSSRQSAPLTPERFGWD